MTTPEPTDTEALRKIVYEHFNDDLLLVCGRVWEAWQYGTMHESDFYPIREDEDILPELVERIQQYIDANYTHGLATKVTGLVAQDSVASTDPSNPPKATPDNDIDDTFKNYRRQIINGLQEGAKFSNSATIAEKTAKAALTRNRDIYAVKARIDEHGVLEALGVGPFPLRVAELRAELAALEGKNHV